MRLPKSESERMRQGRKEAKERGRDEGGRAKKHDFDFLQACKRSKKINQMFVNLSKFKKRKFNFFFASLKNSKSSKNMNFIVYKIKKYTKHTFGFCMLKTLKT